MEYTISNEVLNVIIDDHGSQLLSIKKADVEYLWQRDPKYWNESSPMIFPFVARLKEHTYYMDNEKHIMNNHGFARDEDFEVKKISDDEVTFTLKDNENTYKQYPRRFTFTLRYKLISNKLSITYEVKNDDERIMYFGLGGHPGFNVPLDSDLKFEDYYIEYETNDLKQVTFTPDCFVKELVPFKLDDKKLYLRHEMFDDDAIVLKGGHKAILKTDKDDKKVIVEYPNMDYFGIWHRVKTDAPYVCLEPWLSLPARIDGDTIFETEEDLIHLNPKEVYKNTYTIEIV